MDGLSNVGFLGEVFLSLPGGGAIFIVGVAVSEYTIKNIVFGLMALVLALTVVEFTNNPLTVFEIILHPKPIHLLMILHFPSLPFPSTNFLLKTTKFP